MREFRILGALEVVDDGRPLDLGGPKQRALLAILLLHRRKPVSSDRLIDLLWGEEQPATAAKTLQAYVSRLRKVLGDGALLTQPGGYRLVAESLDAERFDALVADAHTALGDGDARRARRLLDDALDLWRGDPLADLAYEPWAQADVARLEEARLAAVEERIDADLALGRHRQLAGELEALVAAHPARERLLGQLMLALYRGGRQADALRAYQDGRRGLDDELGLEPGPELRELERRILEHDPTLRAPAEHRVPAGHGVRRTPGRRLVLAGVVLLAVAAAAALAQSGGGGRGGLLAPPNSLAAIDAHTGRVVAQVGVGARPGALVAAAGSVWVANRDDATVSRVDEHTLQVRRTIAVTDPPTALAATRAGVWVVTSAMPAASVTARRIDPQFDAIERTVRVGNVDAGSPAAAVGEGARLLVAPESGELTSIDASTGRVQHSIDPNAGPAALAVGAGAAWVTDGEAGNVTRIDASGLTTAIPVGHDPSGIAVGSGAVWVANRGDDTLARIDPSTGAITSTTPVGSAPVGVAVGAGAVWVADSGDGTVTRVDPGSGKAIATIHVGGSPQALTIDRGRVWVTVDAPLPATAPAATGGTLRIVSSQDVDALDPALSYSTDAWRLLRATCAELLGYPDVSGPSATRLIPDVAEALPTRSRDGRTYTFTLRRGFRFSPPSTETVTAQTFKDTIERTLDPRMKSPIASEFADIVGARDYIAGKAPHINGVVARRNTLTVRLVKAAPDLPTRLAMPNFCALPSDTPVDPRGLRVFPTAGPYRVSSYVPGQGIVLTRNPNYHGPRPHRVARIVFTPGVPAAQALAQVQAGRADYATDGDAGVADARRLRAPGSRTRLLIETQPDLDFFALNTHRPLFADVRLRRAASYAIDRRAIAAQGDFDSPLPVRPTDHYLPPGVPGHRADLHVYPLTPDAAKARQLADGRGRGRRAILYTCEQPQCARQAQILSSNLAAIGMHLVVRRFAFDKLFGRISRPGEPYDITASGWGPDYPDPAGMLNAMLTSGIETPVFVEPRWASRLAAAARLGGARRYLAYGRLDEALARDDAPLLAYGNAPTRVLLSTRVGCVRSGVYGLDLAALCLRR